MARRLVVAFCLGFAGVFLAGALGSLPFLDVPGWVPAGIAAFVAAGMVAGVASGGARVWLAMLAGALTVFILNLGIGLWISATPSVLPIDEWRSQLFLALVGSLALMSLGFAVGRLVATRGLSLSVGPTTVVGGVAAVAAAGAITFAFSYSDRVVQPDATVLHVVVTDEGIDLVPREIGERNYIVIYESRASRSVEVWHLTTARVEDGLPAALTSAQIDDFISGRWEIADRQIPGHRGWSGVLQPGTEVFGGYLWLVSAPGEGGGVMWYTSSSGQTRRWMPDSGEDDPESELAWPVDAYTVLPVVGGGP